MKKEQLAEHYAENRVRNPCAHTDALATGADLYEIAEDSFIAGYEAAEPKWIPFNRETSKQFESAKNKILLFDDGTICSYNDPQPFAIMTHFLPIPNLPNND